MKVYELSLNRKLQEVTGLKDHKRHVDTSRLSADKKVAFTDVLQEKIKTESGLKFSAHALRRLEERNVDLGPAQVERLREGVLKAEEKGAKSSLILMDNQAFIVSVKNKVVVTVLNEERTKGSVFTNIDSVAIV